MLRQPGPEGGLERRGVHRDAHVGEHADAVAHEHVGIGERRRPDPVIGSQGPRIILSVWRNLQKPGADRSRPI